MAMTANERKRAQIQREQEAQLHMPDSTYPYLAVPFYQYVNDDGNWSDVQQCFQFMGIEPPQFEDDRGAADFAFDDNFGSDQAKIDTFKGHEKSIGRAEAMVGFLIDAASGLSQIINAFKQKEVTRSLAEIQKRDLADPDIRKATMAEVVYIARLQDELQKNVRRSFPQWEVKILPRS